MTSLRHHLKPEDVLRRIGNFGKDFHNQEISMASQRYQVFKYRGLKCANCNNIGTHFRIERHGKKGRYHLNLYTDDGILMTKDHIKPKSKGGLNVMANYQTMCETCNKDKGSIFKGYFVSKAGENL